MKTKWWKLIPLLIVLIGIALLINNKLVSSFNYDTHEYEILSVANFKKQDLFILTNEQRASNNVPLLAYNTKLELSATDKCRDMVAKGYWSHNAPDGTEPWVFIKKYTNYAKAGENLSKGQYNSLDAVKAWMESPLHKKNMVDSDFTSVGFGVCYVPTAPFQQESIIVVQHFAKL